MTELPVFQCAGCGVWFEQDLPATLDDVYCDSCEVAQWEALVRMAERNADRCEGE